MFLEQEAKEKFLRMILEQSPRSVEKSDIAKAVEKKEEIQKMGDEKNQHIEELMVNIEQLSNENSEKYRDILQKESILKEKFNSVQSKREELEKLKGKLETYTQNDTTLPKLQELFNKMPLLAQNIQESDLNPIEKMQRHINEYLEKVHELQNKIENMETLINNEKQRIHLQKLKYDELKKEDEYLSKQVDHIKELLSNENFNTPENLKRIKQEESLRVMMNIWSQISNIKNFKYNEGLISFHFKDFPEIECLMFQNEITHKLEKLKYETLDDEIMRQFVIKANNSKDPVSYAIQQLYQYLLKTTKSI